MSGTVLQAHSLAEAYLYFMATPCPSCGKGPLRADSAQASGDTKPTIEIRIPTTCAACARTTTYRFSLPHDARVQSNDTPAVVNPTELPSRLLDVAQWLLLFRVITEAAAKEPNKPQARRLGLEAAQCLEEALKFYEDDNSLPPESAFFDDASRERLRRHPEQFARERLIDLRAKLPKTSAIRQSIAGSEGKPRRWWRRG